MADLRTGILAAIMAAAFAGPGCAGQRVNISGSIIGAPGNPAQVTRTIKVIATDTAFDVQRITVREGQTVRFVVTNKGASDHEFVINTAAANAEHEKMMETMGSMSMSAEPNSIEVRPGQTKQLIWRFGQSGKLQFACDMPGHREAGMVGVINVRG